LRACRTGAVVCAASFPREGPVGDAGVGWDTERWFAAGMRGQPAVQFGNYRGHAPRYVDCHDNGQQRQFSCADCENGNCDAGGAVTRGCGRTMVVYLPQSLSCQSNV
jgi:hypothetical protein